MKLTKYLIISILVVLAYSCAESMLLNPDETPRGIFVTYDPISSDINSEDIEGTPVTGTFTVTVAAGSLVLGWMFFELRSVRTEQDKLKD